MADREQGDGKSRLLIIRKFSVYRSVCRCQPNADGAGMGGWILGWECGCVSVRVNSGLTGFKYDGSTKHSCTVPCSTFFDSSFPISRASLKHSPIQLKLLKLLLTIHTVYARHSNVFCCLCF